MKNYLLTCVALFIFSTSYTQAPLEEKVTAESGDVYTDDFKYGMVLTAPNGDCYRVRVLNDGTLITESISCNGQGLVPCPNSNIDFVNVSGGTFQMGCTPEQPNCSTLSGLVDENPAHAVTVSSFQMSRYEVTVEQYVEFLNAIGAASDGSLNGVTFVSLTQVSQLNFNGGVFSAIVGSENQAVLAVSWQGADAFANWACGRLPTEAEWEFAARGGNSSQGYIYSGSNVLDDVSWWDSNSGGVIHDIGTKMPNEIGIYDMSGNASELVFDWYDANYYNVSPSLDPQGPSSGTFRVTRGGGFNSGSVFGQRVSYRGKLGSSSTGSSTGFRIAK